MAWYTEQMLADYLNLAENHEVLEEAFKQICREDIKLEYGTSTYDGQTSVFEFLRQTANAIAKPFGFVAAPVIIFNTDDPQYGITADKRWKAVALMSKLEDYTSWFFFIRCDDNFQIARIFGTQGMGYQYYADVYEKV